MIAKMEELEKSKTWKLVHLPRENGWKWDKVYGKWVD